MDQEWREDPYDRAEVQDQLNNDVEESGAAPLPSIVPTLELQMDAEQAVEVTVDQGWGEGEAILGDSASHADIEKEEGNDSSSDSNDTEWPIETDMPHLQGNTVAQVPPPSLPRQAPRKRSRHRRKGRCKQDDGVGRVRESEEKLPLRSYCSSQQVPTTGGRCLGTGNRKKTSRPGTLLPTSGGH